MVAVATLLTLRVRLIQTALIRVDCERGRRWPTLNVPEGCTTDGGGGMAYYTRSNSAITLSTCSFNPVLFTFAIPSLHGWYFIADRGLFLLRTKILVSSPRNFNALTATDSASCVHKKRMFFKKKK